MIPRDDVTIGSCSTLRTNLLADASIGPQALYRTRPDQAGVSLARQGRQVVNFALLPKNENDYIMNMGYNATHDRVIRS